LLLKVDPEAPLKLVTNMRGWPLLVAEFFQETLQSVLFKLADGHPVLERWSEGAYIRNQEDHELCQAQCPLQGLGV